MTAVARKQSPEARRAAARAAVATMRRERGAYSVEPINAVEVAAVRAARAAMSRARRSGLPYDPDLPAKMLAAQRAQDGRCALSGVRLTIEVHGAGAAPRPFAPSIDRIQSGGGYTGGNCRVVAWAVNCFCGVWGEEVAMRIARGMVARANGDPELAAPTGVEPVFPD